MECTEEGTKNKYQSVDDGSNRSQVAHHHQRRVKRGGPICSSCAFQHGLCVHSGSVWQSVTVSDEGKCWDCS